MIKITSPSVTSYTLFRPNIDTSMMRSSSQITISKLVMSPTLSPYNPSERKLMTADSTWTRNNGVTLISKLKLQPLVNKLRAENQKSMLQQETVRLNLTKDANYELIWTIWTMNYLTNVKIRLEINKKLTDWETSTVLKSVKMLNLLKELRQQTILCIRIKRKPQICKK